MLKYWFKNRFILDLLLSIVLSLLFIFAFFFTTNANYNKVCSDYDVCLNSNVDYHIPTPSVTQLEEIKNKSFVDDVFGYYFTSTSVSGTKSSKTNIVMSNQMNSISLTPFNDNTLIKSVEKDANYALIDEKASNNLGVDVGSKIKFAIGTYNLEFTVSAIYKNTSLFDDGVILIDFSGSTKEAYESKVSSNSYSAAFIKCNNGEQCEEYLKNYIPLGRLRDRSEFSTDEEYNAYNNAVMSGNYSNEITNYYSLRSVAISESNKAKNSETVMCYIGASVVGILYIVICLMLRNRKSEKIYFSNVLKNKEAIKKYRVSSLLTALIVYCSSVFLFQLLFKEFMVVAIPTAIASALFIVAFVIDICLDKKYLLVNKKADVKIEQKNESNSKQNHS